MVLGVMHCDLLDLSAQADVCRGSTNDILSATLHTDCHGAPERCLGCYNVECDHLMNCNRMA